MVTLLHEGADYRSPLHNHSELRLLIRFHLNITPMVCAKFKDIRTTGKLMTEEPDFARLEVKVNFWRDNLYCNSPEVHDSAISPWLYCQLSEQLVLWDFVAEWIKIDVWWMGETQSDIIVLILKSIFTLYLFKSTILWDILLDGYFYWSMLVCIPTKFVRAKIYIYISTDQLLHWNLSVFIA